MRSAIASAVLTALALIAIPAIPQSVHATTGVLRCEMPDGSRVYTNKACSAFGAKSVAMSGELQSRIASEVRYEAGLKAVTGEVSHTTAAGSSQTQPTAVATPARRSVAAGCAATPQQLLADLQGSIALGDVNRVAESYHWTGLDHKQGQRMMQRLEQLATRPVIAAQYFDANIGMAGTYADASAPASGDGDAGMLQLTGMVGEGSAVTDFAVVRYQGCYFVRY